MRVVLRDFCFWAAADTPRICFSIAVLSEQTILGICCKDAGEVARGYDPRRLVPGEHQQSALVAFFMPRAPRYARRVRSISLETLMFQRTACSISYPYTQADKHLASLLELDHGGAFAFPANGDRAKPIGSVRKDHDAAVENAGIRG